MDRDKTKKEIGRRLRQCRNRCGLTQAELSEKIGLQAKSYANVETGQTLVSLEVLMNLARALNTSADYILFGHAEYPSPLQGLLEGLEPDDQERVEKMIALYREGIQGKRR